MTERAPQLWRRLGLERVVLLAALLCDLLIVIPASLDEYGPQGRDLLLLPGILGMCACALLAKARPVVAAFAGAAVLVVSTLLIRETGASAYSTLLTNLSLTEVVAGLELVFSCVRRVRPGVAFAAISTLVVAALIAATFRDGDVHLRSRFTETLVLGAVMLAVVLVAGIQTRLKGVPKRPSPLGNLVSTQWPLVGMLCLPLFGELYQALENGPRTWPSLLGSVVTAAMAVLAARKPVPAALVAAGAILVFSGANVVLPPNSDIPFGAIPVTQVLAGMALTAFLVRYAKPAHTWWCIGALSVAVAVATIVNHIRANNVDNLEDLSNLIFAALLLLGISVATGLYFRARDSERAQVMESAVTEAQTSERMALARELHDVVAHHVTGIVVQAQAAKMMGGKDPAVTMEALGRIEVAGTEALTAMRRLVHSMRGGTTQFGEQATTDLAADLRRLVDTAHHGVRTELELKLSCPVPHEVARSALRLVQESLTNIGKHAAGATHAVVLAEIVDQELHVWVSDNGRKEDPRPAGGSGGYGLVGMRERVELLHGRLAAGPGPDGGWRVEAWLPLESDE